MDFKCKPIYLKYPIFQMIYVILWFPFGLFTACIITWILYKILYLVLPVILQAIFSFSFTMFALSGRMDALFYDFMPINIIAYDLVLLIVGLELISCFIKKRRNNGMYEDESDYRIY